VPSVNSVVNSVLTGRSRWHYPTGRGSISTTIFEPSFLAFQGSCVGGGSSEGSLAEAQRRKGRRQAMGAAPLGGTDVPAGWRCTRWDSFRRDVGAASSRCEALRKCLRRRTAASTIGRGKLLVTAIHTRPKVAATHVYERRGGRSARRIWSRSFGGWGGGEVAGFGPEIYAEDVDGASRCDVVWQVLSDESHDRRRSKASIWPNRWCSPRPCSGSSRAL
jgi:hypothetical protein